MANQSTHRAVGVATAATVTSIAVAVRCHEPHRPPTTSSSLTDGRAAEADLGICHNPRSVRVPALLLFVALAAAALAANDVQSPRQYRAVWVDTLHTALATPAEVSRIVDDARAAHLNAIFAEVRHRGDAWYRHSLEPPPDEVAITRGFDPLAALIRAAHRVGIEVHAFVTIGTIWDRDPAAAAGAGLPRDPGHVFRRWSGFDARTGRIVPGGETWLTRTLASDAEGVTFDGHRINGEFWLDFGHPAAAAHTVAVIERLVRRYDLDGLHLDRIRYPEIEQPGQTATTGANIGYNAVSVARYIRHHRVGSGMPAPADARWAEWRRRQVTDLVRRIYLTSKAIKPALRVSAALIAFGDAPAAADERGEHSEAYWRVYQDWPGWLREGLLDVAMPMLYRDDSDPAQAAQYDRWLAWMRRMQPATCVVAGVGAYLNAPAGTIRQTVDASDACGVALFSYASPTSRTGDRQPSFRELAAALTRGSLPGAAAPFAQPAQPPARPAMSRGHLMGVVRGAAGALDTHPLSVTRPGGIPWTVSTDGNGFFGAVGLDAGTYVVASVIDGRRVTRTARVRAGRVTTIRLD